MPSAPYHPTRPRRSLLHRLAQPGQSAMWKADSARAEIFPGLRALLSQQGSAPYCCKSFFRPQQTVQHYAIDRPLRFKDGRLYRIQDITVEALCYADVPMRCCMDVVAQGNSDYIAFEVWFAHSVFDSQRLEKTDHTEMLLYSRKWVWDFLNINRYPVPLSRYGKPYVHLVE